MVVVNETMASAAWPGESALGKRLRNTNRDVPWFTVVGVVRDVRHGGVVPRPSPTAYFLHGQFPLTRSLPPATMSYAVRTDGEPLRLAGAVRDAVRSVNPAVPVAALRPMRDVVSDALAPALFTMLLLAIFAGVALVLATVGIYGLLSNSMSRRGQEIGIRNALGATSRSVLGLVMRDGLRLVLAGLVTGLVAALLLTRLLTGLLYGVRPLDPVTFVAVPVMFLLVAAVATYVPARRAMALDPLTALRQP